MFENERIEIQRQNLQIVMNHHQDGEFTKYLQIKNVECAGICNYGPPHIDTLMQALSGEVRTSLSNIIATGSTAYCGALIHEHLTGH